MSGNLKRRSMPVTCSYNCALVHFTRFIVYGWVRLMNAGAWKW